MSIVIELIAVALLVVLGLWLRRSPLLKRPVAKEDGAKPLLRHMERINSPPPKRATFGRIRLPLR